MTGDDSLDFLRTVFAEFKKPIGAELVMIQNFGGWKFVNNKSTNYPNYMMSREGWKTLNE